VTPDRYLAAGHTSVLASGAPVAPGETLPAAAVDRDDPHDQHLLADGLLIDIADQAGDTPADQIADHTIEQILDWVGDDQVRRQQALDAEQARGDDARKTLVDKLDTTPDTESAK
jgi:hypothetical protein